MTWNSSVISGPWPIPVYGAAEADPDTGASFTPVVGYLGDPGHPSAAPYCIVVPAGLVTPTLQAFAQDQVPAGVPVLADAACVALCFATETAAAAEPDLAAYWTD